MQSLEVLQPNNLVERPHRLGKRLRGTHIIPAGKGVARVDAYSNPGLVIDLTDDISEFLELRTNDVATAAHVLNHSDDGFCRFVGFVQLCRYPSNSSFLGVTPRRSRVKVVELNTESLASLKVIEEVVECLVCFLRFGLCQVHEIRAMR